MCFWEREFIIALVKVEVNDNGFSIASCIRKELVVGRKSFDRPMKDIIRRPVTVQVTKGESTSSICACIYVNV